MENRLSLKRMLLSAFLAASMSLTPSYSPAFAEGSDDVTPAWAVDESQAGSANLAAQAELPSAYDLRFDGGEPTGLMTPVKFRGPWERNWTFGGIAATESAILSATGATYASTGLDLSERHLTYFGLTPVSEDVEASQTGEGLYLSSQSAGPNPKFNVFPGKIYLTTLLSQGLGFAVEDEFPYRGVDGNGVSNLDESHRFYSKDDNWDIAEADDQGEPNRLHTAGYVLTDGNVLPQYWTDSTTTPNEQSITAIKQELMEGRGVSFYYNNDWWTEIPTSGHLNWNTQARYCEERLPSKDNACIVGWDDNYPASNFNANHLPPANGAWIVKDSWGSETDAGEGDNPNFARNQWGFLDGNDLHSGYSYLSYYDQTICNAESMSVSDEYQDELLAGTLDTYQHDYLPATSFFTTEGSTRTTSSANVFTAEQAIKIKSVSTRTSQDGMRVVFAIYRLNDGASNPADGTMVARFGQTFAYSGFHRAKLESPVVINADERFSVIATASVNPADSQERIFEVSAAQGESQESARATDEPVYAKAVVNQGESWLYSNGSWIDWGEYLAGLMYPSADEDSYTRYNQVDNFAIKADAVPLESDLDHVPAVAATCTTTGSIEHWHDRETGTDYALVNGKYEPTTSLTVAALGHSWDKGVVTKKPTSTAAGVRTYTCSRCGATMNEAIAPTKGSKSSSSTATTTKAEKPETSGSSDLPNTGDAAPLRVALAAGALALVALGIGVRRRSAC